MSSMNWGPEHEESPENVQKALEQVVARGKKVKSRRLAIASGATGTMSLLVVVALLALNGGGSSSPTNQIAVPTTAGTSPQTTEIQTLLASQVIEKSQAALESLQGLSMKVHTKEAAAIVGPTVDDTADGREFDTEYRFTARGDSQIRSEANGISISTYSPESRTASFCNQNDSSSPANCTLISGASVFTGDVVAGSDDPVVLIPILTERLSDFGAVEQATYDGRPAWKLTVTRKARDWDAKSVPLVITQLIDQGTALPMSFSATLNGRPYVEQSVLSFAVNPRFPEGTFATEKPAAAQTVVPRNDGLQAATPELRRRLGYPTVVAEAVPDGFKLTDTLINPDSFDAYVPPISRSRSGLMEQRYRSGLRALTITTESAEASTKSLSPLWPTWRSSEETRTLIEGVYAGTTVHVISGPNATQVWGIHSGVLFTVSGQASVDTVMAVVESLRLG